MSRKKIYSAILLVIAPLLFIFLAEVAARFYVRFRYGIPGKSYGIYMADEELGAAHRPNSYNSNSVINNWGFRDTEDISEQKAPGATRIYCSGGSTTFCYNLKTEEAWPALLQARLRSRNGHQRDEVLNAGEISFSTAREFVLAKRFVLRLKPDIVILYGTGINESLEAYDLAADGKNFDLLLKKNEWGVFSKRLDQARFFKRNSVLVRIYDYFIKRNILSHMLNGYRHKSPPMVYDHPWVAENFEHTLRAYMDFLRENSCKIIFVRYGDNGIDDQLSKYIRRLRDRAASIAAEKGVVICDLVPQIERYPKRKDLYNESGFHVTKDGADLVASELAKAILNLSDKNAR